MCERKLKGTKVVCGAKVTRVRKFHGTKVLGIFALEERKFHRSESSMERKFLDFSLPGSECSMERKFHGSESSMVFSLPGTKVQRNEKASYHCFDGSVAIELQNSLDDSVAIE